MQEERNFLSSDYTIETPENVSFDYELAGIGSRFIGALIDTLILGIALGALTLLLVLLIENAGGAADAGAAAGELGQANPDWIAGLVMAIYALVNFALIWGYYVFFELRWNGQTPGKRLARTRVIRSDGSAAGLTEIVIRNLVRLVDFLPAGYALGLVVMFCNSQARRLGDFAAGTLVVKESSHVALATLTPETEAKLPVGVEEPVRYPEARSLSREDYNLVRDVLERDRTAVVDVDLMRRLARAIAAKMGYAPPVGGATREFLSDVAESYRRTSGPR